MSGLRSRFCFSVGVGIFSGVCANHSIMIKENGDAFAIGKNDKGQLGVGDTRSRSTAAKVSIIDGQKVVFAACGHDHTIFRTRHGLFYGAGSNKDGQLCHPPTRKNWISPGRVRKLEELEPVRVICGAYSTYCLSRRGHLHSFGWNGEFQLGTGVRVWNHTVVHIGKVIDIAAGWAHVAALTEQRKLYTFGWNEYGQLGNGVEDGRVSKVDIGGLSAQRVFCGAYHTIVVINSSQVLIFGWNYHGQLGTGHYVDMHTPVGVYYFMKDPVHSMHVGGFHTICVLKSGNIVGFGWNDLGQLMVDPAGDIMSPKVLMARASRRISQIACGFAHTLTVGIESDCHGYGFRQAFGSNMDIIRPKHILDDISSYLGIGFLGRALVNYILAEQTSSDELRTTDLKIEIPIKHGERSLWLNEKYVSIVIGADKIGALCSCEWFEEPTEGVVEQFLRYLYGNECNVGILTLSEVKCLYHFLLRLGICNRLFLACYDHITNAIQEETNDEAANLYKLPDMSEFRENEITYAEAMFELFARKEDEGDIVIQSGTDSHNAHKFILVARRLYFNCMFRGGFRENITKVVRMEMPLGDPFEAYLKYLYTGSLEILPEDIPLLKSFIEYFDEDGEEDMMLRDLVNSVPF